MNNYLVATIRPWNIAEFEQYSNTIKGCWQLITQPEKLTLTYLKSLNPKYIFFPHWSWIVPEDILENYTCVCFHMTDVPFGRGGSPLQNLIIRGFNETKMSALKMTKELDSGDVFIKKPLSLDGSALQIYKRAAKVTALMIEDITNNNPTPSPQTGEVTYFKRRSPEQSQIPSDLSNKEIYDFIRMLDAPGYPNAFIQRAEQYIEFSQAKLEKGILSANVTIINKSE